MRVPANMFRGNSRLSVAIQSLIVVNIKILSPPPLTRYDFGVEGLKMGGQGLPRPGTGAVLVSIAAEGLRLQVVEFLNRCGLPVIEAETGNELLDITEHDCAIALFLADMPARKAPELMREAARRRPDLRALVISGDPEFINRELVPDPCVHFIEKPFAWCELGDKIAKLLRPAAGTADNRRSEPTRAAA